MPGRRKRWSCAIEVDVSFPARDEDEAWEVAESIARHMGERLEGRPPPGDRRQSHKVFDVQLNTESGAIMPLEVPTEVSTEQ